ncbi:MAG: DUF3306 domain-containing protein [Burkholderiaceae bacterium]
MAADEFFARWSKRKIAASSAPAAIDPVVAPIDPERIILESDPLTPSLSQRERARTGHDEIKTSSCQINNADNTPAVFGPDADVNKVVKPLPTLADVEALTAESDYAAFLVKGVDESVKRSAMKKLFALPQFNIMDGLDIYVGDYSQPDPLPPGMLEALNHARSALNPAQFFTKSTSQLLAKVAEHIPVLENPLEAIPIIQNAAAIATESPASTLPQEENRADISPAQQHPEALPLAIELHKNEAV